ncbi:HXXEE domain-containing protein [Oceanobacillus jeddahense]|uniref:HXXEE domain-containing protein n=1 Tax=Oceanobacillus jeddahense TaxID=1462527 RepID=A0ABY5JYB6_9BACI|nr:HXXEE domain-containing protein [Oceanobacillus jeddahense]UUI04795.1 HXXEE domain-containing protein [Oceanobacillus jeddahense]
MDVHTLIWSFLIIFMLHNFEEIIIIERWFSKKYPEVRERIPPFAIHELEKHKKMTAIQFSIVVYILSIVASALIVVTVITEQYFLFFGLNIIFALNIFTHPLQSLLLKCYVPGLWTTLLLIIPYNIIVHIAFYQHGLLNLAISMKALFVIILFIPVFIVSHMIGEKLAFRLES